MPSAPSADAPLSQWLDYIALTHPSDIEMGLGRVSEVAATLGVTRCAGRHVIVAGTNGKGSTCVALEQILLAAGLHVGTTLSPHVLQFNERVRHQGEAADDASLVEAFAAVNEARGATPLTYFEFSALAALWLFRHWQVDVAILEVGLGGRLDAFNLVDAELAIITSIGLEHQAYLGNDVDTIGKEKAGVMRSGQTVVLGPELPSSVAAHGRQLGASTLTLGLDFQLASSPPSAPTANAAELTIASGQCLHLPDHAFIASNCALSIQAAQWLLPNVPPERFAGWVRRGLAQAKLPGRMQPATFGGRQWLLDVGHNPLAAQRLLQRLRQRLPECRVVALFGQLADKDSAAIADILCQRVAHWVLVPTRGERGQSAAQLHTRMQFSGSSASVVQVADDVAKGVAQALAHCGPRDVILAFGAFALVEDLLIRFHE